MRMDRREFLKTGALAAGAAAAGAGIAKGLSLEPPSGDPDTIALTAKGTLIKVDGQAAQPCHVPQHPSSAREGVPGRKWVMVIDLARCDGCGHCTLACNKMHFIPPGRAWITVFQMKDAKGTAPYWFPKPCFHCDKPPCTKVCPVDATYKRNDGVVLIDNERCIGCRFCMAACPYSARSFNWDRPENPPEANARGYSAEWGFPRRIGTVEKCDFCPDMAAQGKLPACVTGCPMGAVYYGDQNEDAVTNSKGETVRLSQLLKDNAAYRFLEELGTEPRVYYLPPKNRAFPGPGEAPREPHKHE